MNVYYDDGECKLLLGDCIEQMNLMPAESVQCVITSPPYWGLRDYSVDGQIGLEETPDVFVEKMVEVFRAVRRVLRKDGTLWLNLGDTYATGAGKVGNCPGGGERGEKWKGVQDPKRSAPRPMGPMTQPNRGKLNNLKPKDLIGIPWRVALALQADGWWLRSDIIWFKPNGLHSSVRDRPTSSHEYLFLLTKNKRYYYDNEAIRVPIAESSKIRYSRAVTKGEKFDPSKHKHTDGVQSPMEILSKAASNVIKRGTSNRRTVWNIPTQPFKGGHFATFPPRLVEPCVLAGTSEAGCCPKCGTPWKRITEPSEEYAKNFGANKGADSDRLGKGYKKHSPAVCSEYITLGWQPQCKCDAGDPVPCVVFDPFGGSGTVLEVARDHGRHGIAIELSKEYCDLAIEYRLDTQDVRDKRAQKNLF